MMFYKYLYVSIYILHVLGQRDLNSHPVVPNHEYCQVILWPIYYLRMGTGTQTQTKRTTIFYAVNYIIPITQNITISLCDGYVAHQKRCGYNESVRISHKKIVMKLLLGLRLLMTMLI